MSNYHVVVIDTSFQRVKVNVNPGTHMTDVLAEACKTLGPKYSNYGFKNNNKLVDMSRKFRETGLPSGAKLELIIVSKTAVPVSVALQIPTERLVETFASDTSLWQILRIFESKNKIKYNFTERGITATENGGTSGSGQLLYEKPVLNILGKEVSSLAEFQKTLAQFGITGGNVLIRLSFQKSGQTFAEAAAEIDEYFKPTAPTVPEPTTSEPIKSGSASEDVKAATQVKQPSEEASRNVVDGATVPASTEETKDDGSVETPEASAAQPAHHGPPRRSFVPPQVFQAMASSEDTTPKEKEIAQSNLNHIEKFHQARAITSQERQEPATGSVTGAPTEETQANTAPSLKSQPDATIIGPNGRPVTITKAPSGQTPAAALESFDEMDYEPTDYHALSTLKRLQGSSQNKRLLSDAEQDKAEKELAAKIAASKISIKIRFPDLTSITSTFDSEDSAQTLYDFVKGVMTAVGQPFVLKRYGAGDIPQDGSKKLIKDLKFTSNSLVIFHWADGADQKLRQGPSLKEEYATKAVDLVVPSFAATGKSEAAPPVEQKKETAGASGKGKGLNAFKKFLPGGKK